MKVTTLTRATYGFCCCWIRPGGCGLCPGVARTRRHGIQLEPEREKLVAGLANLPPTAWTADQLARIKEGMNAGTQGIPLKYSFGSDCPYRECDQHVRADYERVALRPSLARGGFSTVWGAALMPYAPTNEPRRCEAGVHGNEKASGFGVASAARRRLSQQPK